MERRLIKINFEVSKKVDFPTTFIETEGKFRIFVPRKTDKWLETFQQLIVNCIKFNPVDKDENESEVQRFTVETVYFSRLLKHNE